MNRHNFTLENDTTVHIGDGVRVTTGPAHDKMASARALLIVKAPDMLEFIKGVARSYDQTDAPTGVTARALIADIEGA